MSQQIFRRAGWTGWAHPDFVDALGDRDPRDFFESGEPVRVRKASAIRLARTARGDFYIKLMSAPKERAVEHPTLWHRLRWRLPPSRAAQIRRVTQRMNRAGVASPEVVLACRRRDKHGLLEMCATRAIDSAQLMDLLESADEPTRRRLAGLAGRAVARLHEARILHGDCNPRNLLLRHGEDAPRDPADLYFIDNDRTRHWPIHLPRAFSNRNLTQMSFRLNRFSEATERAFLDAYCDERRIPPRRKSRLEKWLRSKVEERKQRQTDRRERPASA